VAVEVQGEGRSLEGAYLHARDRSTTPHSREQRRTGTITFGDLRGRLEVLQVACSKCERTGRYSVARLIERYGADAGLPDWKDAIAADCPTRGEHGVVWDLCGANFPDLPALMCQYCSLSP
jgi:hypothetical protein